ncbi:hypothetical protein ACI7RC_03480 [Brevibacillus sp. B_LB10_24]|uniref:hypothetical protein n=1 Tax=Brevibacillus sp. B_LB10_24 TaxID=3380645 RepID=UPI0038B86667
MNRPLFSTVWKTTPKPVYNSITLNGTPVVSNSTVTNQLFIAQADKPINVVVNTTTYGNSGTHNTLKTAIDSKDQPSLGGTSTEMAYGAAPYSWKFTISDPALLKSGDTHTLTFEARDDYGRSTPIEIKYKVEATQICTDWINATLQLPGQSNKSIPSNGEYKLPAGVNTITLSFPRSGTLKIDGFEMSGNTFSNILIKGPTTLFYKSEDEKECWTKDIYPEAPPVAECDPAQSKLSLHVWMFGSKTNRNVDLQSGSPGYALPTDVYLISVEAPGSQKGSFYLNNVKVAENVGSHDFSVSRNQAITIKYVSQDGKECWIKTFVWDGQVGCPIVYQNSKNGKQISDGSTIEVDLGGSLSLYARFRDTDGTMADAYLYWEVYRPGDTTPVIMDMVWGDKIRTVPTNNLKLPATGFDDRSIVFDKPGGIYRIKLRYDGQYENEWRECHWEITVRVVGTADNICKNSVIEAWLDGQTELPMTKDSDGNYALTIMPGNSNVYFEAFYDKKQISSPEWTLKNSAGQVLKSTTNITNFIYKFTDKGTYTLTAKYQINSSVGVIDCSKTVTINVKTIECEEIFFHATVDGKDTRLQGSSPYTIRMERGQTNELVLQAVYPQSNVTVTGDWVLKKNGTTLRTVLGKNPFSHTFDDKVDAVYTLEVTVYVNGEPCRKTFQIVLKGLNCSDVAMHMKSPTIKMSRYDIPNGGKEKIVGDKVEVTFWLSKSGDASQPINAVWSGPFSNTASDKNKEYTMTGLQKGSYTVTAKVNDSRYPSLNDCTFTFTVEITDQRDCSSLYIHVYDSAGGRHNNVNGQTIQIKASNGRASFGVLVSPDPNTAVNVTVVSVDWIASHPNDLEDMKDAGYTKLDAPPGTYTIKAVVNDNFYPNSIGCTYTVTVVIADDASPPEPPPGGDVDGGQVKINIYDSENRLLVSQSDGVWEREPARIEVVIDQGRIDAAFSAIDAQINAAIQNKVSELYSKYSGAENEDVEVTADPPKWSGKTSVGTNWPSVELGVTGPGQDQRFSLNPKQASQSNQYTGTTVPTQTTWRQTLQTTKYTAAVDTFTILVPYQVDFMVSFQQCVTNSGAEDGEPLPDEKVCTPGRDSDRIEGLFAIVVKGDETRFEVFEPNAKGIILHTAEWSEYHQRDRYKDSQPDDFYAGERILAHLQLESRHKHPVSGKYPRIESAAAWISETGRQSTTLQSKLSLTAKSSTLWTGPGQMIEKLGLREVGVDTPLMGDKQKGFQKDARYAVYFSVQFGFQVNKGFAYPDKTRGTGRDPDDYRAVFRIIANAWERQGIRNHTTH